MVRGAQACKDNGSFADGCNGLYLQVKHNGSSKSWIFRFTFNGKRKEMGLGPVKNVSLVNARQISAELMAKIKQASSFNLITERKKDKANKLAVINKKIIPLM